MFGVRKYGVTQRKQLTNCLLLAGSLFCFPLSQVNAVQPQSAVALRSQKQPVYQLTLEVMTRLRQQQDKHVGEAAMLEEMLMQRSGQDVRVVRLRQMPTSLQ